MTRKKVFILVLMQLKGFKFPYHLATEFPWNFCPSTSKTSCVRIHLPFKDEQDGVYASEFKGWGETHFQSTCNSCIPLGRGRGSDFIFPSAEMPYPRGMQVGLIQSVINTWLQLRRIQVWRTLLKSSLGETNVQHASVHASPIFAPSAMICPLETGPHDVSYIRPCPPSRIPSQFSVAQCISSSELKFVET